MTRTIALLVVIVVCGGCEREPRTSQLYTPSPTVPSPITPPDPPLLAVAQITGRVVDADFENPISGAHVTADRVCYQDLCPQLDQPYSTVTDHDGYFRLSPNLPQGWRNLSLKAAPPGFEPAQTSIQPGAAHFAVLMAYRSIAIRAGESVQLRVLHFQDTCFEESIPCRRISVDAHADESITLEVEPAHPEDAFGILATNVGFSLPPLETRLTVRGGAVWIVRTAGDMAGTGMVTVTARR